MTTAILCNASEPRGTGMFLVVVTFAVASVTACVHPRDPAEPHLVKIRYVRNCPDLANPPKKIEVKRGERVEWQSVESNGSEIAAVYRILFDPFVGNTIDSDKKGRAVSIPIAQNAAQEVEYKYTVVRPDDESGVPTCPPLDPRLRVGR